MTLTTMSPEIREALSAAVMAEAERLRKLGNRGTGRSQLYLGADGHSALMIATRWEDDGTQTVFQIEGRKGYSGAVDLTIEESTRVSHNFWREIVADPDPLHRVVVGDHCYHVDPDSAQPGWGDGYGGRRFVIEHLDDAGEPTGETTVTRNLWSRGTIPPVYRDQLKPNARFANPEETR